MKLKPCPFCGNLDLDYQTIFMDLMRLHCLECGANGSCGINHEGADDKWNIRKEPEESDENTTTGRDRV